MKKLIALLLSLLLILSLTCCGSGDALSPNDPVTLTMWHVYGEQAGSPMDLLIEEFNRTVGQEEGVFIKVTNLTNTTKIGSQLQEAKQQLEDAPELPDLFTVHINDALALGADQLLDWNTVFSKEELEQFADGFLADGTEQDQLLVFPISKSTHVLMLCGSAFQPFAQATGTDYETLSTWDGFYQAAADYYNWSGGKSFCAFDYPLRAVELDALSNGSGQLYQDGWYDFSNPTLKESWLKFARSLVQGHVVLADLYSNTQVMTGEVLSGIGSSAAILYYNDTVTYPDGTSVPMDLQVLPYPASSSGEKLMTQAGVGLCAFRSTDQKNAAAALFLRWFTESQRNLDFVTSTGYMPVRNGSFDAIEDYSFQQESYSRLYHTLDQMRSTHTLVSEPRFPDYYGRVNSLYESLRQLQPELIRRCQNGEDPEALALETWELFSSIQ